MSLLIPVAKNKTGETVTPTSNKEDGPFACLGCAKPLVLRQGEKNQWHFAHHSNNNDECSAGGETYIHWRRSCCWSRTSRGSSLPQSVVACVTITKSNTKDARRCRSTATTAYTPRMWPCFVTGIWKLSLGSWRRTRQRENRWHPE
ncbi:unnamed protein product [Ectocarpus fasciculatus]